MNTAYLFNNQDLSYYYYQTETNIQMSLSQGSTTIKFITIAVFSGKMA